MVTDSESFNRNVVPLDEKNTLNIVRDNPRDVPTGDILDAPLFCLKFNESWRPHITGAIDTLSKWTAWNDAEDDTSLGTIQIWKLLAQDMTDCTGDCPEELTIPEIIADDTYFTTEYVPKVFGEYYSNTVTEYAAQEAIYDDTPQSVAPDVPTGVPNTIEQNALCYAVNRFVELYASQKLCLIQSQNWLESLLSDFANAANDFYNAAADLMLPFYSANIFSCFVDDTTAITALQDTAAIEELACHLYDYLKAVTMSQANFDAAILDAATTLTGNAQDIACLLQNDNAETIFISFLLGYNIALERQAANEELECPCESGSYWVQVWDFANGEQGWKPIVINGVRLAVFDSTYWKNDAVSQTNAAYCYIMRNFDRQYVFKCVGIEVVADGLGTNDSNSFRGYQHDDLAGTNALNGNTSGINSSSNGTSLWQYYDPTETHLSKSYAISFLNAGNPTGTNYTRITKAVLYGEPSGGLKPPGSVWVSSLPVSPDPLFP